MLKNYFICLGMAVLLFGCSVGSGGNPSQEPVPSGSAEVKIGNVTTIPSAHYTNGEYTTVNISNYADSDISLQNTQINANGLNQPAAIVSSYIDLSGCLRIGKGKTCNAKILTNPSFQSYLLSLTFADSSGKEYTANQIISTNNLLPVQDGFIYDATQLNMAGKSSLSIPFRLADDYTNVSVTINDNPVEFGCYQNKYKSNTLCTAIVKSTDLTGTSTQIKITGYNGPEGKVSILTLSTNQAANIITSGQNVLVNPDDGTSKQTVYLVNSGLSSATNIIITPKTPITIESVTCTATTANVYTLGPNSNCSFAVNVTGSLTSGQSSVGISYSDGQNTQVLYFNVSYFNQVSPALTLTQSGNFNNIVVNTGPIFVSVNVTNTGTSNLTNMVFNNLNLQNSTMSSFATGSTCTSGQSLQIGQSCVMVLSYSPTGVQSGTVNFIPTATYIGPGSENLTYANSILNLAYSSIASATFIAVGDFGTIISSTNSPPTTWTATLDSPIGTTATTKTGMVINGTTYALMLSTGVIESSTQNGLFWRAVPATLTGITPGTCGIIFDGAHYYTCGQGNASVTAPCTNTSPCIESSTNLTTWKGTFKAQFSAAPYNNIVYIPSPTPGPAWLVGQPSAGLNKGIAASTNGVNFSEPSTGLAAANSNVTAFAANINITWIFAWTSTGYHTVANTAPTNAWDASNTDRPESPTASQIGGVVFNANTNTFYIGTYLGNIYTSGSVATAPYTTVYSGSSSNQIKGIAYASGTDSYVAATSAGGPVYKIGAGSWTLDSSIPESYSSVYLSGNNFWLVGNRIYTSSTPSVSSSWLTPALNSIAKNGTAYLTVDNQGFIYSSANLVTWAQQTNPSGKILSSITCPTTNLCLAVGATGAIIRTTDGGANWAAVGVGLTSSNLKNITCQPYPGGVCLAVGGTGAASTGTVLVGTYSSNYTSWTANILNLATTNLNGAAFFNGEYIVVGDSGALFMSANNGTNWSSKTSGAGANNLNSITCGALGCVAVGNSGSLVFSATGSSWASQTSGVTTNLNSIIYKGVFVTVGKAAAGTTTGVIRYSADGITWNAGTFPASSGPVSSYSVISN